MSDDTPFLPPVDASGNPVDDDGIFTIFAPVPGTGNSLGIYSPNDGGPDIRGLIIMDSAGFPVNIILGNARIQDAYLWAFGGEPRGTVIVHDSEPLPPPPPPPPGPDQIPDPSSYFSTWYSDRYNYSSSASLAASFVIDDPFN
jgi:hypothetical protein